MKLKKGITLIALVVTIIILLVLAAVTVSLVLGPNGVIEKARGGKVTTRYATIMDKIYERDARLEVALRTGGEEEPASSFIAKLIAEGLITSEDSYEDNIISLGLQKDGTYKYTISVREGILNIADMDLYNSLPDANLPENAYLKDMTFIVRTTNPGQTVTLPISNTTGLTINWDAGENEEENENNYTTPQPTINPTYTYSQVGDHEVRIRGKVLPGTSFGTFFNPETVVSIEEELEEMLLILSKSPIVELKYWGENDFSIINSFAAYLEKDIPAPSRNSFIRVSDFSSAFAALGLGPHLEGESQLEDLHKHEIPENLFAYAPSVKSFDFTFAFAYTLKNNIPAKLFINSPNVTRFYGTFFNSDSLTEIPAGLFANCSKATNFGSAFNRCRSLTTIPSGLFSNCQQVTSFYMTFYRCSDLTEIGPGLFTNCTKATIFRSTFEDCHNLTEIPAGLFVNSIQATDFALAFAQCNSLIEIPTGLFINCTYVTSFEETFTNCYSLIEIPAGLFDNCLKVTNFKSTFAACLSLTGNAPELWNRSGVDGTRCFTQCGPLANYSSIPANWK